MRFEEAPDTIAMVRDASLDDSYVTIDLRDESAPEVAAREWMADEVARPLDLTRDRTALFALLWLADDQHLIYMRGHHLVADGVAALQLLEEWGRLYTDAVEGRDPSYPPPEDFGPALEADAAYLISPRRERDRAYWREQLTGVPPPPYLSRRTGPISARPHRISGLVPPATLATLRRVETTETTTLPAVIGTALTIYLSRMTGQRDIQFALPVAARTVAALRKTPLPVSNVVPIRTQLNDETTVVEALRATQSSMLGALRHQRYRYEDIRADLAAAGTPVPATPGVAGPVLNLMLTKPTVRFGEATGTVQIVSTGPIDDISLTIYPRAGADGTLDTQIDLDANPNRYTGAEARSHHARFLRVLGEVARALLDAPELLVADLPLLDDAEYQSIATVTGPGASEPFSLAALAPEVDDASSGDGTGAVIGGVVTVEEGRGDSQTRGIWAAARRPEPLLILDPDLPTERRRRIVDLVEQAALPASGGVDHPDAPEYLVFTSGTTGEPKGVVVSRRGIGPLVEELRSRFVTEGPVRVAQLASPSFDATVFEHVLAAALGGTLLPAPPGTLVGPTLARFLNEQNITHAVITPTVLATMTPDDLEPGILATLMTVGEALPAGLAATWARGRELHNLYGPAETTIMTTAAHLTPDADGMVDPVIGRPIAGTSVHVLDARLRPVPPGAPGELYVAGPSLALGYLADTPQTATRFVADPFLPGARMYRTGDLVAWDHDLTALTYLGRADSQVQIRGVRVELAEVESVATLHDDVDAAVATVLDDWLVLYVVTRSPTTVRPGLRRLFADRLSPAMWPSQILAVDGLPVAATGKVDREALTSLVPLDAEAPYRAPATATERDVAAVVSDALGVTRPSMAADIVDLGATSLNATEIATALSRRTGTAVTVRDVLTAVSLQEMSDRIDTTSTIAVPERPAHPPASPQQAAMVVSARLAPESTAEVLVGSVTLRGAGADVAAVRSAVGDVMARHEILRTVVRVGATGELWQDVLPIADALATVLVDDVLPDAHAVTDPTRAVPAQVSVREHGDNLVVAVAVHHALVDDASMDALAADLAIAYAARRDGTEPAWTYQPLQYADATAMLAAALGDPADPTSLHARQREWWAEALADLPARPRLPTPTGPVTPGVAQVSVVIPVESLGEDTYPAAHAVLAAVIARFTGSLDLTLLTVHSGRDRLPARAAAGMFVNPVAVRTRLQPGASLRALTADVSEAVRDARLHGDIPIADVARAVEPRRAPTTAPLSDVLISYRGVDRVATAAAQFGLDVEVHEEPPRDPRAPLQWNLDRVGDGLRVTLTYDTTVLDEPTAAAMVDAVDGAFAVAAANSDAALHQLVPGVSSDPWVAALPDRTIVDVVLETASSSPGATALIDGEVRYPYADVVAAAQIIGSGLAALGVGQGDRVAIALPRSGIAVLTQLGVQMTGAAYVPVDVTLPTARIAAILEDAAPVVVLGDVDVAGHRIVGLDDLTADADWQPVRVPAGAEAYVIFTSGSTGRPKGVSVSHRAVVAMLDGIADEYSPVDVFSCVHSLAFDFSVFEILVPWRVGGTAVLADTETARDPAALWHFLVDHGVTVLSQTPPAFDVLAAYGVGRETGALRQVVFGGAALNPSRLREFASTSAVALSNLWGITEGAVHVTSTPVDVDDLRSLIGEPLPAMAIAILDATLQPVPIGVWGELYIAGAQLADGYVGSTARTAERFVAGPGGTRMYRTGDIVRRTYDGGVEYLGRSDDQVQLRGFRVELAEVEAALRSTPGVDDAVASVREAERADGGVLVAHVIADGVTSQHIRDAVAERLPSYAVPSRVVLVDAWPLTTSGKIDRAALPVPSTESTVPLGDDASELLPTVRFVVGEVLGVEPSSVDPAASLLDLGAQSLSYMHIAVGLARVTGRQPAVRDLVTASTIGALAEVVAAAPPVVDGPVGDAPREYTPSSQQRGLWFLHRIAPESTVYHLPLRVDLDPAVGFDVIRGAAFDLTERHEILRTVLTERDGRPVARVLPLGETVAHIDAAIVGREVIAPDLIDVAVDDAVRAPFDLGASPGWRIRLWDIVTDGQVTARVLVIVAHHAVADGWSVQILGRDVLTALAARVEGRAPVWTDAVEPYGAFAARAAARGPVSAEVLDHWRAVLDDAPTHLSLPAPAHTAVPGPERAMHLEAQVGAAARDRFVEVADACGTTPFHLVHVALTQVLSGIVGDTDIVVGVPTAGRDTAADLATVGMTVRMAVLRSSVDDGMSVRGAVAASSAALADATGANAVDYENLVTALAPTLGSARQPYLDVIVAYAENAVDASLVLDGPVRSVTPLRVPHARVPLEFTVTDSGSDGLSLLLTVGTSSVDVGAAELILSRVVDALEAVATGGPDVVLGQLLPADDNATLVGPTAGVPVDPAAAFRERVADAPAAVAVVDGDHRVTYGEMADVVDTFVDSLIRFGAGAGSPVMVTGERSAAMLAVMIAVCEAGSMFVPVDPSYPAERQALIQDAVWPALPIVIERDPDGDVFGSRVRMYTAMGVAPAEPVPPADQLPAYVLFTSGSTGTPKGVVVSRAAMASMLSATLPLIDAGSSDVWTWSHSPAFDFSVWETWGPLTTGGSVVIVDGDTARDPAMLSELIVDAGVTVLSQTPTAFTGVVDRGEPLPSLRWVVFGGEALAPSALGTWAGGHPAAGLLNLYGITETTVHLTQQVVDVDEARSVIGAPLAGMSVRVLDSRLRPVPVGGRGELHVVGPQVAAGYMGQPGLTAERFVAAADGQRMYRTGDHVRRIDADRLEYLGRTDDQVQIRGFRVELGEVSAALRAADGVVDARVMVRSGPRPGDETLLGFVVGDVDGEAVRAAVAASLPPQSVPSAVVVVRQWPLTPTGKVDTAALLRTAEAAGASDRPLLPPEEVIAAVVADLTGAELAALGPDSSFFALGGSSLTAARLAAGLSEVAGATIGVRSVFENPTVAGLAALVDAAHDVGVVQVPGPVPMPRPDRLPLTPQQEEVWLQWTLHPEDTGYHLVGAVPVDPSMADMLMDGTSRAGLVERVRGLVARHDALRTRYPVDDLGPRQELVEVEDILLDLAPRRVDDMIEVVAEVLAPFDLAAAPPWRVRVADTGDGLVVGAVIHHIAADGHAVVVLEREIAALAGGVVDGRSGSVDFASYTQWYRSMLVARADDLQRFWCGVFAEPVQPLRLPGVASGVGERSAEVSAIALAVLTEHEALRDWAIHHRTTVFIAVHAALASVLARRSASADVLIGTATSGRMDAAIADTVGMFARTVPLRTAIDVDRPFDEVVAAVTATDLDAFAHADLPAADIAAIADPDRTTAGRALTAIVLSDLMTDRDGSLALATDVETLAQSGLLRTVFGLDFSVAVVETGLRVALVYRPSTVDETVAQGLVDDVVRVLSAALSRSDVVVGDVLVDPTAHSTSPTAHSTGPGAHQTVPGAHQTVAERTVGGILAAAAAAHADNVALVEGDRSFTYAQLDAWARAIAAALRARGVGRGDVVAAHAPRSAWSVAATWGISYAGAGFLVVNPADPAVRRSRILSVAAPAVVLTAPGHPVDDIGDALGAAIVVPLDDIPESAPSARGPLELGPDDLAYVVFTSGSTGVPKGVAVTHRGIAPMLSTMLAGLPLSPETVLLHNYAPSFDAHIIELLLGFSSGGRVVVCPPDVIGGDAVHDLIDAAGVNTVFSTPAMLSTLDPARMTAVRVMGVGGEAVPQRLAAQWSPDRQLVNLYGPTETTVVVTTDLDMDDGPVDVGRAVAGSTVVVLDDRLRPVPDHTVGELYIRGESLARGYVGRPDLTAERFVADPATPGARIYRTGDLVHRRADGTLVTHGRTDSQLAVRGLRVEPGEIDAALVAIDGVRDALADLVRTPAGADVLAAWVVPDLGASLDVDGIRRSLRETLPRGMVPALITVLDELPLTANGKIDRRALPEPSVPRARPAQTPTELAIVAVWAEVIGIDPESIDTGTDFFAVGGSSFSATRVVGRLREATGRDVSVRQVFDARTVADLATDLDAMPAADARGVRPVHLPTPASTPLAYPQRRMWFLNRLEPESTAYTVPIVARIVGDIDVDRVRRAVRRVAMRHQSLRTVYPDTPDGPLQVVLAPGTVEMPAIVRGGPDVVAQFVTAPVDLTTQTAFRAALMEDDGGWTLAVVMHHVAVDGWSLRTLLADLVMAYTADADLPAPELTYIDVTRWQLGRLGDPDHPDSEHSRQLRFWRQTLAGVGEPLRLPGHDYTRAGDGGRVVVTLADDLTAAVATLAQETGATVFHVVHAAVATVLAAWNGTTDVVVGAPVLGRADPAIEPVVGMFVNTVALRTALDPTLSVRETLTAVRDADLTATAHDGVPYDAVARAIRPDHRGRHDPLVSVLVVQQEARAVLDPALLSDGIALGDSRVEPIGDVDTLVAAKFDVEVVLAPQPSGGLQLLVLHAAAVPESTARALADHLVTLLTAAAQAPDEPFAAVDDGLRAVVPAAPAAIEMADDGLLDVAAVRAVFAEVLDAAAVEADDDFFALGGTSLSTTQVVAALARRTGCRIPVSEVFAHPTAAGLAASLAGVSASDADPVATALARVIANGPVRPSTPVPVTTAQRRIWFADRLLRGQATTAVYAVPVVVPVPAGLSDEAVGAAVRAVVDRHAPLRTVYPVVDGQPCQVVLPSFRPAVVTVDLGDRTWRQAIADPPPALLAHLAAPFDVTADPPVRAAVVEADGDRLLILVAHHLSLDGQSVGLLVADLADALAGRWLPPLDVSYHQWAVAEQSIPVAVRAADRAPIVAALDGWSGVLDLPTDRPRSGDRSLETAGVHVSLDSAVADAIEARARTAGVTPFHLWHAALTITLAAVVGTDDVAVGTPVSVRSQPEIAPVVGMFVSTVVLRTRLGGIEAVDALLSQVRDGDAAAVGSTLVGFDEVVAAVRPPREPGRHPLVQVLLSLAPDVLPALPIGALGTDTIASAPSEFDLQFTITPDGSGIVSYATALFDRTSAEAFGERWLRAVTALVTLPGESSLDAVDLRSPAEVARDAVERSVLATRTEVTLPGVFARAASSFPDDIAVDDGVLTLTYADLDRRSAVVATRLADAGVRPGDRVAMMLPRSVASVVATWAIARVGAVLVPVDSQFPADRMARMIAIAEVTAAVVDGEAPSGVVAVTADDDSDVEFGWPAPLVDAPAYVIFTSGSTGTPNAVVVTHRGLSLFADPLESRLTPNDRVAHHASPSFDASVMELVRAAGAGARLSVIAPDRVGGEVGTDEFARLGVTAAFVTPTILATLDPRRLPMLRSLEVGGEAVPPDLVRRWADGRRVAAAYGPTEATILALWWWYDGAPTPGPMLGTQADSMGIAVLDRRLRPVPDGCVGELYLSGPALAQGYIDPALTASRFVAGDDGRRMYRTGDVVRRTSAGLAFVGRADQQVQIRGVRIELGEVDAAARAVGVARAATVVVAGPAGDTLITYAVADRPGAEIRAAIASSLPTHMVPAQVIVVDELPVTPVGKLDVVALPAPEWGGSGVSPRSETEERVLAAYRAVLEDVSIGVDDDFFAVGGTSLQLIPLVTAIRDRVGADVGLAAVVAHPNAAALAATIDAGGSGDIPAEIAALLAHVVDLTAAQIPPHPGPTAERAPDPAERAETPLWLVHPASGLASTYGPLAEVVGGTVLGLQIPDLLDGDESAPSSVDGLAAAHLAAVRARQPQGPYRFGGWSVGGQIAHAMAQMLVEAGETVDLLVLLDARVGIDVAAGGDIVAAMDSSTADALRAADPERFERYLRRVDTLSRSAAAFTPGAVEIAHTVLVVASDTTDDAVEHWRPALRGRLTVIDVDAAHAELGEPATMTAIGEMLAATDDGRPDDSHQTDRDQGDR